MRRRTPQDLVRPLELPVLLLKGLQAGPLVGRESGTLAVVDGGLLDPGPQGLLPDAELASDPGNDSVIGRIRRPSVMDQPDGPFLELGRMALRGGMLRSMAPTFPRFGACRNSGRFRA